MPRLTRFVPAALVIVIGLTAGWGVSHLTAYATRGDAEPEPYQATRAAYDSTVAYLSATLPAQSLPGLRAAGGADAPQRTLVLLGAGDHRSCEDLGRQLRELERRAGDDAPLAVWTVSADAEDVREFLRRQHVNAAVLHTDSLPPLGSGKLATPAVLRVRTSDGWGEGVAHTKRFPNLRTRSFADELNELHLYRR